MVKASSIYQDTTSDLAEYTVEVETGSFSINVTPDLHRKITAEILKGLSDDTMVLLGEHNNEPVIEVSFSCMEGLRFSLAEVLSGFSPGRRECRDQLIGVLQSAIQELREIDPANLDD